MLLGNRSVSRGRKASSPEFSSEAFNMIVCPDPSAKYSCWLKTNTTNNKHRWSYNQNQTFSTVEILLISFLVLTCRFLQFDLRSPKCEAESNQQLWHLLITTAYSTHLFSTQKYPNTTAWYPFFFFFTYIPVVSQVSFVIHTQLPAVCVCERERDLTVGALDELTAACLSNSSPGSRNEQTESERKKRSSGLAAAVRINKHFDCVTSLITSNNLRGLIKNPWWLTPPVNSYL